MARRCHRGLYRHLFLYSLSLKHLPGIELTVVASGFVLRALGGAVATHVPPSGWFLTVCSLGALMVAIGKRYTELSALGEEAIAHRPVMRWYSLGLLRAAQRAASVIMLAAYLFWALSEHDPWMRGWHVASVAPLALALIRFDRLTGLAEGRPVEDLIVAGSDDDLLRAHLADHVHGGPLMAVVAPRELLHPCGLRQPDLGRKVALW